MNAGGEDTGQQSLVDQAGHLVRGEETCPESHEFLGESGLKLDLCTTPQLMTPFLPVFVPGGYLSPLDFMGRTHSGCAAIDRK